MKIRILLVFFLSFASRAAHAATEPLSAVSEIRSMSIEASSSLKELQSRYDLSRSSRYSALTRWFPRVDFQLADSWSQDYSALSSGSLGVLGSTLTPQDVNLKRWTLNGQLPLYRRSVHLGFEKASRESLLVEAQWRSRLQEWDVRFADLLGQCLLKRFEIRVLERSIEAALQSLNEARIRLNMGQTTKIDFLRAEAHLSSLTNSRIQARAVEEDQKRRLVEFTGIGILEFERVGLLEDERDEESVMALIEAIYSSRTPPDLEKLLKQSQLLSEWPMSRSLAYRQFELEENVSASDAGLFMAQEWPELLLQGSYGRQSLEWNQLFDPDQRSRSFSIVLNIPLFSGGSLFSSAKERSASRQIASLQAAQKKEKFLNDTAQSLSRARTLRDQLKGDIIEESRFEEILRLTRKSYQVGKLTQREVLESERDWLESRLKRARSVVEFGVLVKQLNFNLGVSI